MRQKRCEAGSGEVYWGGAFTMFHVDVSEGGREDWDGP